MTFDLTTIAIFYGAALIYSLALPRFLRGWALMLGSLFCVYWLQTLLNVRFMDFILPTAVILLTVTVWLFTRKANDATQRQFINEDRIAFALILLAIVGMSLNRFLDREARLTPSRPPDPVMVALVVVVSLIIIFAVWHFTRSLNQWRTLTTVILLLIAMFITLKAEPLAEVVSRFARSQTGQRTDLAKTGDLAWVGFSYVAFRLIHALRDRQSGRLPALSLREFTSYTLFFPAYIAGPIDRAERFIKDFRALPDLSRFDPQRFVEGTTRVAVGIFKKFVLADTLALIALSATSAEQSTSSLGTWALLYAYAFRLFFDFSGYSDIAIGIGILFGIKLPENFDRPYLKTNLAAFWQSWHITLSNWARFYVFTPLSRVLLQRDPKPSPTFIVLTAQLTTMIVIGLWHGFTLNFLVWGLWHGVGLFLHKQWSDRTQKAYRRLPDGSWQKRLWTFTEWFVTFQFVVLGWVWFALPSLGQALDTFALLFGVS